MKDQAKEMSEYRASFDRREPLVEGRVYKDVFLISLVIPGPKAYDDLNSFLSLLVDELKALHDGVPDTYNVYMQTRFTLRGHLLFVSGDGRAVADVMQMSQLGNARRPCRTCEIEAIRGEGHYYVFYDGVLSGTARTNLRNDIRIVEECMSKKEMQTFMGIKGTSILTEIRSIHFPRSFSLDTMHCMLINNVLAIHDLWK
ncbi:hypothetical protein MFRU_014g01220 [Monilinia fructicola]|nr:hypothetical protein MFRU_014g01220 [Monilinia fructicola]